MKTEFFIVSYRRIKKEKTSWPRIGTAFPRDGGGYTLKLDSLPIDSEWDGTLYLFPNKDEGERKAFMKKGKKPAQETTHSYAEHGPVEDEEF